MGMTFRPALFGQDDQATLVIGRVTDGQRPALVIDRRIEPVDLAVQANHRNGMIERQRRRLPLIEGAALGGVKTSTGQASMPNLRRAVTNTGR